MADGKAPKKVKLPVAPEPGGDAAAKAKAGGDAPAKLKAKAGGDAPKGKAARARAGGWAAFSDGGTAPRWVLAARIVLLLAFAATIPTILGVRHGNRLTWTVCIAALPFFWMAFGYHLWRRICPLAVMGQLGRLLGRPGTRKMGDWMGKHYLLVQLGLMLCALTLRLVATNGSDAWLAGFLGVVVAAAIATSFVYGGKTWCNFLCPVGLVEKMYTEPARAATGGGDLTSQCSPCVACKKHCPDIDLEQGYWKESGERSRRLAYFAWPGVVIGFYTYYYLAAGSWAAYFDGRWAYDRDLPRRALEPGFFFLPEVPRIVAAPLTLLAFGAASFAALAAIERALAGARRKRLAAGATEDARAAVGARVRHGMLAFAGLFAFNAFYVFAGQPSLRALPGWLVQGWGLVVVFASTAIFARRVMRREDQYVHEKFAQKILKKWEWGDAPPSDKLEDIYLLHTERTKQREARLRAYKETVREMVADGLVTRDELAILGNLRAQLGVSEKDHQKIVGELSAEERQLFDPAYRGSQETRLAREAYRKDLERIVVEAARSGAAPAASTLAALRAERGVGGDEEAAELARILAPGGPIAAIYHGELAELAKLAAAAEAAAEPAPGEDGAAHDSASLGLLRHLARLRAHEHAIQALGLLHVMTTRPEVEELRAQAALRGLVPAGALAEGGELAGVDAALREPLEAALRRLERGAAAAFEPGPLLAIAGDPSRHLRAAAALLLSRFEDEPARARLLALVEDPEPIVRETVVRALGAKRRLTRDVLTAILADPSAAVRHAAIRAVAGGTTSGELPALDPGALAQSARGAGPPAVYATLDANAAMAALTTIEKMMLIRQVPIFRELAADDLEELATIVEERRVDADAALFLEGDPGDAVYLIVKGSVQVFTGGQDEGRPRRVLSQLGPGACIGEMAVLDAAPRSATVRALERTRTLRVPGEGFKRVLSERPEMSQAIVAELVKRMRGMMAS